MKVYGSDAVRNVVVVGHGSAGKTTLVDALAFVSGSTKRHGSIKEGNTLTDTSPDEIERQHSITLGLGFAEWMDTKVNLLDTPGYLEFYGDVAAAMAVADAAIVVLSGTSGVEVGTEKVWTYCDHHHLPRILFVSQMDKEHANFGRVFDDVRDHLTPKVLPVEIPVGDGADFKGIINLFTGSYQRFVPGSKTGEFEEEPIPEEHRAAFSRYMEQFTETVAGTDDALIEKFLSGVTLSREEIVPALKRAMIAGEIVPLFCGSGERLLGIRTLLTELVELLPSPLEAPKPAEGPLVGRVFKIVSEPHVGDISLFRLYCGGVKSGADVWNHEHNVAERLGHLSVQQGRDRLEVAELAAGDIGSVAKLKDTHTNDTFCHRDHPVHLEPIEFPEAEATSAVLVKQRGEEDKLAGGLHKLHEEDPTFHFEYNSELGQTLIHGLGERHFEVILGRLARKYGVHAELVRPRVAYRETIKGSAEGQGKHKKQSGGRGQYGDCWIRVAPRPRGAGYEFVDKIVGGVIPGKYIPAVDRGIQEAAERGALAGYPMVDFRVECFDGSYHDVDSNEMSFKMAGILAFRAVAAKAGPVLLEPIMQIEVDMPSELMGDVLGDLTPRRGQVQQTEAIGRLTRVTALVPQAELYKYSTTLHSITHGRGTHRERFHGYAEAPPHVAAKVAAENAEKRSSDT